MRVGLNRLKIDDKILLQSLDILCDGIRIGASFKPVRLNGKTV